MKEINICTVIFQFIHCSLINEEQYEKMSLQTYNDKECLDQPVLRYRADQS